MKVLQLVDAGNLCVSGSSIDRTFFSLFPEFEDRVGNLVVKVLQEVNQRVCPKFCVNTEMRCK